MWQDTPCACGPYILATWIPAAWSRCGARRYWRKRLLPVRRVGTPAIPSCSVSSSRRRLGPRYRPIFTPFMLKPVNELIGSTRQRLETLATPILFLRCADNSITSGSTCRPNCEPARHHGSSGLPWHPGLNPILCFMSFPAASLPGRKRIAFIGRHDETCTWGRVPTWCPASVHLRVGSGEAYEPAHPKHTMP